VSGNPEQDRTSESRKKKKSAEPAQNQKKGRSPIERIIVWGVIIALGLLALNQYAQHRSYERDLKVLEQTMADAPSGDPAKYADVRSKLSKEPEIGSTSFYGEPADLYIWRWRGVKTYEIRLVVRKETGEMLMLNPQNVLDN